MSCFMFMMVFTVDHSMQVVAGLVMLTLASVACTLLGLPFPSPSFMVLGRRMVSARFGGWIVIIYSVFCSAGRY